MSRLGLLKLCIGACWVILLPHLLLLRLLGAISRVSLDVTIVGLVEVPARFGLLLADERKEEVTRVTCYLALVSLVISLVDCRFIVVCDSCSGSYFSELRTIIIFSHLSLTISTLCRSFLSCWEHSRLVH